jgi:ribonuclease VapC
VIAVDTSALMAMLLGEPQRAACIAAIAEEDELLISAGTVVEALIVATRRNIREELAQLIDQVGFEIVPVTAVAAQRIGEAYARWGKGRHPAALNLGDCFAYEVAKERGCRLLYIGDDFARTDIQSVL